MVRYSSRDVNWLIIFAFFTFFQINRYVSVTKNAQYIIIFAVIILFYERYWNCNSTISFKKSCQEIKKFGKSQGDGVYWIDPDGGNHSNAFQAYCDMSSYEGGWTMFYTTKEYAKPKTEVAYRPQFPYSKDGYRTNCNNIPVSWL